MASAADNLDFSRRSIQFMSAGASYDEGPLLAQGMISRLQSDTPLDPDAWSGFVSCGVRVQQVVPYLAWSRIVSARASADLGLQAWSPMEAQVVAAAYAAFLASNQNDQHTLTLGLRWNFAPKADLKVQVDAVQARDSGGLWRNVQPGWNGRATVASAVLDFVF
jgi:hypothetical protein